MTYYLLISFLILLPFHPFLATWSDLTSVSILRDLFILIFFLAAIFVRIKHKKPFVSDKIDWVIFIFGLWFVLSYFLIGKNLTGAIYSLRYSFAPWLLFWSARTLNFPTKQKEIIIKTIFYSFIVVGLIGFFHGYILPRDFFLKFGYSPIVAIGNGIWDPSAKLPAIQLIPGDIVRMQSTLSGPIQLAVYTLIILGLILASLKKRTTSLCLYSFLILAITVLLLTFTRSAWIGFVVILLVFLAKNYQKLILRRLAILIILLGAIFIFFLPIPKIQKLINSSILRPSSSVEHQASIERIWRQKAEIGFWGRGVGFSGPASFRLPQSQRRAVENSYLRTYEELGVLGVILLIYLLLTITGKALALNQDEPDFDRSLKFGAGLGLLAISTASLFTDSLTEPIPLLLLGVVLALALPQKSKNKINRLPTSVKIFDIPIWPITSQETLKTIDQFVESKKPHQICTVNAEFLVESLKNSQLKEILQNADLNTADGAGVIAAAELANWQLATGNWPLIFKLTFYFLLSTFYYLISGLITGLRLLVAPRSFETIPERVTGADLSLKLCQDGKHKIFFFGGQSMNKKEVVKILEKKFPKLKIAGISSDIKVSLDGTPDDKTVIAKIADSKADILLAGLGSPRQELFINRYKKELKIPVMIGVGGSIDLLLGLQKRAPKIFQVLSLEWLWRFLINFRDPIRRRRIYVAVIKFPWLVFKSKIS